MTKGTVLFKINGKSLGTSSVSNGVARYSYYIPTGWGEKSYKINVVYGENNLYNPSRGEGTLKVLKKQDTYSTLSPTSVTAGSSTTFTAHVTSSSGATITGGKAVFKINGKTIGSTTVSSGYARVTITVPSSWKGSYTLTLKYGGHGHFKSHSKSVTLSVKAKATSSKSSSKYSSYTKPTANCQSNSATIKKLAKKITKGASSTKSKAKKIFNYVRNKISYSSYFNTLYGAKGTYKHKTGNCVDQSHLLIALMRASKIPARYNHATCYFRSGLVVGHVWAQVYVNGKWYKCDPTSSYNKFGKVVSWNKHTKIVKYRSLPF